MKVSVFGIGYVGSVFAAYLSARGYSVVGVDVDQSKLDSFLSGRSAVPGLEFLISAGLKRLSVTTDVRKAIHSTDISFICVGTPCLVNGNIDLSFIKTVCRDIGRILEEKKESHTIVVRSTVLPGTTNDVITPILQRESGKKNFKVCYYPEFLRERYAVTDFINPEITVVGSEELTCPEDLKKIIDDFSGSKVIMSTSSAEMVKYACNTFHALKVAFANEIDKISREVGADGEKVMEALCLDTRLNTSSAYLKPGEPFGGSCLPKDLQMLVFKVKELGLDLPVIQSILSSNRLDREVILMEH